MSDRRRLLWIGDAACESGFARCTHHTLDVLRETWDVSVLGLNYRGDPHSYPYPIYPCMAGGDIFGFGRISEVVPQVAPDLIVIQNDPWNIPAYMSELRKLAKRPVIAALAVDGLNCRGHALDGLTGAIFWTEFGLREARKGGYAGPAAIVPLGVDLDTFRPYSPEDRTRVRRAMEFSRVENDVLVPIDVEKAFIIGNINRNQPRKRMDLTIANFAEWVHNNKIDDAYLFLHVAPTGEESYDCYQLAEYFGVADRLILSEPAVWHGISDEQLVGVYNCFDLMVTTTQGEGWGLTTMEGMACGVPQIVPDWSALGEWAREAACLVPCNEIAITTGRINVIGGVVDGEAMVSAMDRAYRDEALRSGMRERGLALVAQPQYRWRAIGEMFGNVLDATMPRWGGCRRSIPAA